MGVTKVAFRPSRFIGVTFVFINTTALRGVRADGGVFTCVTFSITYINSLVLVGSFNATLIFFVAFLVVTFVASNSVGAVVTTITSTILNTKVIVGCGTCIAGHFTICHRI